ncbi:unnamed protein product, partial [Iphiclides podalirius]
MSLFCEINLFKSYKEVFVAGSTVKGVIRYAVNQETIFNQITVSLKGKGLLSLKRKRNDKSKEVTYWDSEDYLDISNEIVEPEEQLVISAGSYEIPFSFNLPHNIPSSFHYSSSDINHDVSCSIRYNVSIKFQRPGWWKFDKKYKKEIQIDSGITPRLPLEPAVHGKEKKLSRLFARKNSVVNIKACVAKSVVVPGDRVELEYEVQNDTNVKVNAVETKIVEVMTFRTKSTKVTQSRDVPGTECKAGSIKCNENQTMCVPITMPVDRKSLDFSRLVARDYFVIMTVELPFPHFNAVLRIPIQVGESFASDQREPPPSYWEAMGEEQKDDKHSI